MSVYYIQPVDPQALAARFSQGDTLEPLPECDEQWKNLHLDKIKAVLDRLPKREADLIRLYYFRGKRQTDIAEIFGITQAAVSYRLQRALKRIRFLVEIPEVTNAQIFKDLHGFMSELDAKIFSEMFTSTCQSEVAEILDISQGRVRHRFISNLTKLGEDLGQKLVEWSDRLHEQASEDKPITPKELTLCDLIEDYLDLPEGGRLPESPKEADEYPLFHVVDAMREVHADDEDSLGASLMLWGDYYKSFLTIRHNFNLLREIKLPKWDNRPNHSLV